MTADDLRAKIAAMPYMTPANQGEYTYENPNTGVYCMVGNERVAEPAKGFRSLDMAFMVNYARPAFFAEELFAMIAGVASENGLLLDNEQSGRPAKFDADKMTKEWLRTNDKFVREVVIKRGADSEAARQPRTAAMEQWRFLYNLDQQQAQIGEAVYVARLFYFADEAGKLVTAATWPDCIPIVVPPHTDYLIGMQTKKKWFKTEQVQHGMFKVARLLTEFPGAFQKQKDGSFMLGQAEADKIREEVLSLKPDLAPGVMPGTAISPDRIIDVPAA